jgi:hypothetical protein
LVAANAKVVTELAASVAGNDPGPLTTVQTTNQVDLAKLPGQVEASHVIAASIMMLICETGT